MFSSIWFPQKTVQLFLTAALTGFYNPGGKCLVRVRTEYLNKFQIHLSS